MHPEWHDRMMGHSAKSAGQTYGDYDLRALKGKIDLIEFEIETHAAATGASDMKYASPRNQ
jgi:hypothetical protein